MQVLVCIDFNNYSGDILKCFSLSDHSGEL